MTGATLTSSAAVIVSALAWELSINAALASDREFRAVLDRLACAPERVIPNRLSARVVIYEVTCKQTGKVVHVECLAEDCRLLVRPHDDNDR